MFLYLNANKNIKSNMKLHISDVDVDFQNNQIEVTKMYHRPDAF
jgi:hypothetical protein